MTFLSSQGRQLSFKSFAIAIGAIATVLVIIGLIGFWRLTTQSSLSLLQGNAQATPTAAVFVPRQAPVMVSLLAPPEQWMALQQLLPSAAQRSQVKADWQRIKESLQAQTGLSYDTDIQPWLGNEITFAITDIDRDKDSRNGLQPGYLLAVATKDGDRAREFLELFWQRQVLAGVDLTFKLANGVRIIHAQDTQPKITPDLANSTSLSATQGSDAPLATAVVGNQFMLLANDPKILERSIRNAQVPDLNLDHRADYQQSLPLLASDRVGLLYVNLPQSLDWLGLAQPAARSADPIPQGQALLASITLNRQGLRLNTALSAAAQVPFAPRAATLSRPVENLQHLPADTIAAVSGHDLERLWLDLEAELNRYTQLPSPLVQRQQQLSAKPARRLVNQMKAWLTDDYALGCLPAGEWILVTDHNAYSASTLDALDQLARDQGLTVSPLTVNNQMVTAWTRIKTTLQDNAGKRETTVETDILGVHTTVGNQDVLTTSLPAMAAALKAPQHPLSANAQFKDAIASLQRPNEGIVYLDWSAIQPALRPQPLLQLLETSLQPFLKYVKTMVISSYGGDAAQRQGDILIQIADR